MTWVRLVSPSTHLGSLTLLPITHQAHDSGQGCDLTSDSSPRWTASLYVVKGHTQQRHVKSPQVRLHHYLILLIPNSRWDFSTGPLARSGNLKRAALAVRQHWIPLSYPGLQTHKNPEVYLTAVRCSRDPGGPSAHRPNCLSKHNNQQLNWPAYFIATGNTVGLSQLLRWRVNNQRPHASSRTHQRIT